MTVKVVFMGTPDFAVPALEALIAAGHQIVGVYSQPPRKSGRGMKMRPSPVHQCARKHNLDVFTPASLKSSKEQHDFAGLGCDVAVVAAYGLLLPAAILAAPRLGCFNIHASLLPRWRGAAPIQRAIMAGDTTTGISIMRMGEGLDDGPVCLTSKTAITPGTTAGELHDRLAAMGAQALVRALDQIEAGSLECTPQSSDGVTWARKIDKQEARIDFHRDSTSVLHHIHGLSPWPGAWCMLSVEGKPVRVKILAAQTVDATGEPGVVLDRDLTIACTGGAVRPLRLQRQGRAVMEIAEFLRGNPVSLGQRVG